MLQAPATRPQSDVSADHLWQEIDEAAHEGCLAKCTGRHQEARHLMDHTLPRLIRDWSEVCDLPVTERKEQLQTLFAQVQERVATAIISRRLAEDEAPAAERRSRILSRPVQLTRRIPIHDVAGMIDALNEVEQRWNPRTGTPQSRLATTPSLAPL